MMGDWWYIRDIRIQYVVNMWRFPGHVMGSMDQWTEVAACFCGWLEMDCYWMFPKMGVAQNRWFYN